MRKTIVFIIFITIITVVTPLVTAQTPTPPDLGNDVVVECVTFNPADGYGEWPDTVEAGTFTGTCSSKTKCDIMTCLPDVGCVPNTGFVKLASGNNFFSPGEINETGQSVNVQDHTGYYLYASHTPESLGKGADGENTQELFEVLGYDKLAERYDISLVDLTKNSAKSSGVFSFIIFLSARHGIFSVFITHRVLPVIIIFKLRADA